MSPGCNFSCMFMAVVFTWVAPCTHVSDVASLFVSLAIGLFSRVCFHWGDSIHVHKKQYEHIVACIAV